MSLKGADLIPVRGRRIDPLDLLKVFLNVLCGLWIVGVPTFISLHTIPKSILVHIIFKDTYAEIHIILDLEEVNAFLISGIAPGREVDLHNSDGIGGGNGEWIGTAFNNQNAGNQPGIDIVFAAAIDHSLGDPTPVSGIDLEL